MRANKDRSYERISSSDKAIRAYEEEALYYVPIDILKKNLKSVDLTTEDQDRLVHVITDVFEDSVETTLYDQPLSPGSDNYDYFTMRPKYTNKADADRKYGFV